MIEGLPVDEADAPVTISPSIWIYSPAALPVTGALGAVAVVPEAVLEGETGNAGAGVEVSTIGCAVTSGKMVELGFVETVEDVVPFIVLPVAFMTDELGVVVAPVYGKSWAFAMPPIIRMPAQAAAAKAIVFFMRYAVDFGIYMTFFIHAIFGDGLHRFLTDIGENSIKWIMKISCFRHFLGYCKRVDRGWVSRKMNSA